MLFSQSVSSASRRSTCGSEIGLGMCLNMINGKWSVKDGSGVVLGGKIRGTRNRIPSFHLSFLSLTMAWVPHPLWRSCVGFGASEQRVGFNGSVLDSLTRQLKIRRTRHRIPPFRKRRERIGHPFVSQEIGKAGHPAVTLSS